MTRSVIGRWTAFGAVALSLTLIFGSCGGGGGGGGGAVGGGGTGALISVSFLGVSAGPGAGPNAGLPLPEVFIDQTLEFTFDGNFEDGVLGGFRQVASGPNAGQNEVFLGVSPSSATGGIPYLAYNNQPLAAQSLEIRTNAAPSILHPSYIIGRHRDKPNTLVVDPKVSNLNPFGLPFGNGFIAATEYTYRIPPNNNFRINGNPLPTIGISPLLLPIILPPFTPQPTLSQIFRAGTSTGPDPVPPQVVSITALSGAQGTVQDPLPCDDPILITFTKAIDGTSINNLVNLTIRNVTNNNSFVPGDPIIDPLSPNIVVFTPTPGYGPGPFTITVVVGLPPMANPANNLRGVPQGTPPTQLTLANQLTRSFLTETDPMCVGASTVIEDFETTMARDASFVTLLNAATWNAANAPGQLCGPLITGTAFAQFSGNPGQIGTRFQRTLALFPAQLGCGPVPIPPPGVCPAGLFSPFDSMANNLGAAINSMGGSHTMLLYESADLALTMPAVAAPRDSLELLEWGPVSNFVTTTVYNNLATWCGMTTITGPSACATGTGLSFNYSANYDTVPPQPMDILNTFPPAGNGVTPGVCPMTVPPLVVTGGGVRVFGPGTYMCGPGFTQYYPFPAYTTPFDYLGSGAQSRNLLIEHNIPAGAQVSNFNRFRATNLTPARRLIGSPKMLTNNCFMGTNNASNGGCDIYDMRFTFVSLSGSARSTFYDTGVTAPTGANFLNFSLNPSPVNQPAGTTALWELEAANTIVSPTVPGTGATQFQTYWSGGPLTGSFTPATLTMMNGRRYFRFRSTLRNDAPTNGRQCYNSFIMAYSF